MTLFVDMDEVIADTYGAHIDCYNTGISGKPHQSVLYGPGSVAVRPRRTPAEHT